MDELISNSLLDFVKKDVSRFLLEGPNYKILDLGCGSYSLFEKLNTSDEIIAIDKNVDAIQNCPESKIKYIASTISDLEFSNEFFDFILDSHVLHCITDFSERKKSLDKVFDLLKPNGIFASETMVKPTGKNKDIFFPDRLILSAREIEDELIGMGFKIKFFLVSPDLYFLEGSEQNEKCDLLRFIVTK